MKKKENSETLPSRREFLVGAAAAGATAALSQPGEAQVPGPRATKRPNILLLISDQHRYDWVGRNPDIPVPTPHIDALAARGVDFTRAIVPAPVCGPSRSCLASGMEYENCSVAQNRDVYNASLRPTFFKHLHDGGYHTMGVGKIDLHKGPGGRRPDGRLHMEEWGFSDMLITGSKSSGNEPYGFWLDSLVPPLARDQRRRHTTARHASTSQLVGNDRADAGRRPTGTRTTTRRARASSCSTVPRMKSRGF